MTPDSNDGAASIKEQRNSQASDERSAHRRLDPQVATLFGRALKISESVSSLNDTAEAVRNFLKDRASEIKPNNLYIESVFRFLQSRRGKGKTGTSVDFPVADLKLLFDSGYETAVATVLAGMDKELLELDLNHLDLIILDEAVIDLWLKQQAWKNPANGERLKVALTDHLVSNPLAAVTGGLGTWCCRNAEAGQLKNLVSVLVTACHRHPPRAAEMFSILVARDKSGDFIVEWIQSDSGNLPRLVRLAQLDARLFDGIQKSASVWLNHGKASLLVDLFAGMHADAGSKTGEARVVASSRLLSFAGSLIPLAEGNQVAADILHRLQSISVSVWKEAAESPDRRHTWAIVQAGSGLLDDGDEAPISPESAAILGLALRKARKGRNAITELESALVNIGLERFGSPDSADTYDPIQHDDIEGGLIPGDAVSVVAPGFRYRGKIIAKATVREIQPK